MKILIQKNQIIFINSATKKANITSVNLNSLNLYVEGSSLLNDTEIIAVFNNEQEAALAYRKTRRAIIRFHYRNKAKWLTYPLLIILFMLTFNGTILQLKGEQIATNQSSNVIPASQPNTTTPTQNFAQADPQKLAAELADATSKQNFTIQLSSGHKNTIYVFSDPLCPHCQQLEPLLLKMAKTYNIVIFPVTMLGKQETAQVVIPVLCQKPQARATEWQKLFEADITLSNKPQTCTVGTAALAINDKAFEQFNFKGTPTLIDQYGRQIPLTVLQSKASLSAFIASGATNG